MQLITIIFVNIGHLNFAENQFVLWLPHPPISSPSFFGSMQNCYFLWIHFLLKNVSLIFQKQLWMDAFRIIKVYRTRGSLVYIWTKFCLKIVFQSDITSERPLNCRNLVINAVILTGSFDALHQHCATAPSVKTLRKLGVTRSCAASLSENFQSAVFISLWAIPFILLLDSKRTF